MRRVLSLLVALYCLLVLSCNELHNDNETINLSHERDKSLAGSISIAGYKMDAEAQYDGVVLDNIKYDLSYIDIEKVSDNEVYIYCFSKWDDATLTISIPVVWVLGESYNATFDYISNEATVTYNSMEYTSINTSIKGWIQKVETRQLPNNEGSSDPATLNYNCEINIECIVDNKSLNFNILSVAPY